tara:strand:+ start:47 stop:529 length:483 start_codon:yes stop_codon:yes gene_type:complete
MKDQQVSDHNLQDIFDTLQSEIKEHKLIIINSQPIATGKWGMARLWRAWMSTTAKYMAGNGAIMPLYIKPDGSWYGKRPFDHNDAHELFTRKHLNVDESGRRLSWAKSVKKENEDKERAATKGERVNALRKHEDWCVDKGIILFNPRDSVYKQLLDKQEE